MPRETANRSVSSRFDTETRTFDISNRCLVGIAIALPAHGNETAKMKRSDRGLAEGEMEFRKGGSVLK